MDRTYEANRIRNNTADLLGVETAVLVNTQVLKQWNWNRDYVVKWDLTKSLRLDYNGRATARKANSMRTCYSSTYRPSPLKTSSSSLFYRRRSQICRG